MCGNGVRCFARFIAELENLQGRHRYGFISGYLVRPSVVHIFSLNCNFVLPFRDVCKIQMRTSAF